MRSVMRTIKILAPHASATTAMKLAIPSATGDRLRELFTIT